VAEQAAQVEACLARKRKTTEKAKRWQAKEMEIACYVRMGEDRDAMQEEYESEPSTDSDDGDRSEEEELESAEADSFMVRPCGTTGLKIPEGAGTSVGVLEARKCTAEDDAAKTGEAKRA
jgi:hypothetical protein